MKLIKPSWKILEQTPGIEGIYEAIERAGRVCYKSERPKGKTAKDFVDMLINRDHLAMLEHGTVYLKAPRNYELESNIELVEYPNELDKYQEYSKINEDSNYVYVTTNYRVLYENDWLKDLKYLCEPTEYHEKRVTVHFITSIGIVRELLRHRKFSFANESTRYCNYSLEKRFGSEITYIIPSWVNMPEVDIDTTDGMYCKTPEYEISEFEKYYKLLDSWAECEQGYLALIEDGTTPQEAREVLPLATKSELIMTGFVSDWKNLFELRSSIAKTGQPHPNVRILIDSLMQEFIKNYISNEKF